MSVKPVLQMGTASLLQQAEPVTEFATLELQTILQDMQDTMRETNGVGIAATQLGYAKRIIMFGFEKNLRYPNEKPVPVTILINPEIEILDHEIIEHWEGCLSVSRLRGLVPRYKKLRCRGFDFAGKTIEGIAEGFPARIIQHEMDHINGILFPCRIKDLRNFGFEELIMQQILTMDNFRLVD